MTGRKKGWLLLALGLGLYLLLSGYSSDLLPWSRDITQVKLMRTMALDVGDGDMVQVTLSGGLQQQNQDGSDTLPLLLSRQGLTVFGSVQALQTESDGYVEMGHLADCVIGEGLAREGLEGLADFLERDFSMRLGTRMFLLAGDTGENALRLTASKTTALTERLEAISQNRTYGGKDWPFTVRTYLAETEDNGVALLPVLELADNPDYDPENRDERPEREIHLTGLACLVDQKLAGVLTGEESRGASLLSGWDQLDRFEVELPNGTVAGIRLVLSQCRWEPEFDETGRLTAVTARLEVQGELNELTGWADLTDAEVLETLEQGFLRQVASLAQAALDRSQGDGADFLHIRRQLAFQCPAHSTRLLTDWEDWFPTVELRAAAEGKVERSYDVDLPMKEGA
ncbi:MAG: hypothetical protein LUC30_07965 [Clostridiales bacterium]|nr:hypothetical protein [Clostridiales bacterium]